MIDIYFSISSCKLGDDKSVYYVVGTGLVFPDESEPKVQTDRQTDRQIDRLTDRQTDNQTDRQSDRQMERQMERQMDRQMDRQIDRHKDRQTVYDVGTGLVFPD